MPGVLAEMDAEIRASFAAIAERGDVDVTVDQIWEKPPIEFDPRCVDAVREAAAGLGYAHQDIVSGAGHDACQVCTVAPTGMIFVPCEDGISHNEIESATPGGPGDGLQRAAARHAMAGGSERWRDGWRGVTRRRRRYLQAPEAGSTPRVEELPARCERA